MIVHVGVSGRTILTNWRKSSQHMICIGPFMTAQLLIMCLTFLLVRPSSSTRISLCYFCPFLSHTGCFLPFLILALLPLSSPAAHTVRAVQRFLRCFIYKTAVHPGSLYTVQLCVWVCVCLWSCVQLHSQNRKCNVTTAFSYCSHRYQSLPSFQKPFECMIWLNVGFQITTHLISWL